MSILLEYKTVDQPSNSVISVIDLLPPPMRLCDRYCLSVCHCVCLSACEQYYWQRNQPISLKLGFMIEPANRKNWLTFGRDLVQDTDSGSLSISPIIAE